MNRPVFPLEAAREAVARALDEDLGPGGDISTRAVAGLGGHAVGEIVAREELVAAGLPLVPLVFDEVGRRAGLRAEVTLHVEDGTAVAAGTVLATVQGPPAVVLGGERVALNFLGRLTGIATLTASAVREVAGTGVRVSDTRKTTPGLRALEKYAVAAGGGENHRASLDAMVMLKDNHKLIAGGVGEAIRRAEAAGFPAREIEVEVETLSELDEALAAGAGWILLDNMPLDAIREAVRRGAGRARLEVSGGLRPGALRPVAETGVDRLSLGALTHGARAMDVALDVRR
ncbi:MAG: carboxylating nicotinate-nucleotide diphosphorylase [Acidobacteria bacterium]|jgi:nicotinate-nucleotide pyrophosphorylase (carboxylating)|nr:carboxylating nicotinate-nucleotide diphosphorylase [Acidobacteriota bacterium]